MTMIEERALRAALREAAESIPVPDLGAEQILRAAERLEADSRLNGKLRVNGQEIEIFFNDRLLAPNNDATRKADEHELKSFLQTLFYGAEFSLSYAADRRKLFGATARASRAFPVADLLANLNS